MSVRGILQVRFEVEREPDGSFSATCRELGARVAAPTLPALESQFAAVANGLLSVPGSAPVPVIVRTVFPPMRPLA